MDIKFQFNLPYLWKNWHQMTNEYINWVQGPNLTNTFDFSGDLEQHLRNQKADWYLRKGYRLIIHYYSYDLWVASMGCVNVQYSERVTSDVGVLHNCWHCWLNKYQINDLLHTNLCCHIFIQNLYYCFQRKYLDPQTGLFISDVDSADCLSKVCFFQSFNTLRPGQDGRHFPDDIFKCIFLNENV